MNGIQFMSSEGLYLILDWHILRRAISLGFWQIFV
jgi:hypothetical protein